MTFLLFLAALSNPPNPQLVTIPVPPGLEIRDFIYGRPISYMTCAREMQKPLLQALRCVETMEKLQKRRLIRNYGGCFVNRKIAGTNRWSYHAHGLAIDLNVPANADRYVNLQPKEVVACFRQAGFDWGGDWTSNPDYMHFSLSPRDET